MSPAILIAGATGNTGQAVVKILSEIIESNPAFSRYQVLGTTRSAAGHTAQTLAKLRNVHIVEKNWADITADWLRQHSVERAFIASHLEPSQFPQESSFHVALLRAEVKYVVRVSTAARIVVPDSSVAYARAHWAVEAMLACPEFDALKWTSLQPTSFTPTLLASAVAYVKEYRKTGRLGTLRLMATRDVPAGVVHPDDIGAVAAHLLTETHFEKHHKAKYVMNGPEDISGKQIVEMVEQAIGGEVTDVQYEDVSIIDEIAAASPAGMRGLILSMKGSLEETWTGHARASDTSKEVIQTGLMKRTPADSFRALLEH